MSTLVPLRERMKNWVPPWLSSRPGLDRGWRFLYTIAVAVDATVEFTLQGMMARLPGIGTPTALGLIGRDRRITRGFAESDEAYAVRLERWRDDWKRAGNAYAVMRQVRAYLSPHKPLMRVVNANGTWYTLNPDDSLERHVTLPTKNWDWDGEDDLNSRCWLLIYPPPELWTRDGVWGDSERWGDDPLATWGSTATSEQVIAIRNIVAEWKSAGAIYQNILIVFDDAAFDPTDSAPPLPDGTWALASREVGGVQVPARDPAAIYWDGVAT